MENKRLGIRVSRCATSDRSVSGIHPRIDTVSSQEEANRFQKGLRNILDVYHIPHTDVCEKNEFFGDIEMTFVPSRYYDDLLVILFHNYSSRFYQV